MPLSVEQVAYIEQQTDTAGSIHKPEYGFVSTRLIGEFLNIVVTVLASGELQGGNVKGHRDWLTNDEAFRGTVAKTITAVERHLR